MAARAAASALACSPVSCAGSVPPSGCSEVVHALARFPVGIVRGAAAQSDHGVGECVSSCHPRVTRVREPWRVCPETCFLSPGAGRPCSRLFTCLSLTLALRKIQLFSFYQQENQGTERSLTCGDLLTGQGGSGPLRGPCSAGGSWAPPCAWSPQGTERQSGPHREEVACSQGARGSVDAVRPHPVQRQRRQACSPGRPQRREEWRGEGHGAPGVWEPSLGTP